MEAPSTTSTASNSSAAEEQEQRKSALQDNLERKQANAYYYAHAHRADGPAWDGKAEPKLLSRCESTDEHRVSQNSTFDYSKSNINKYAFLDDGAKVKLYLDMESVGEKCTNDDVELQHTERSLHLVIRNYKAEPQILSFGKLTADISDASYRIKKDRVTVTLTKADPEPKEWHTINDKGTPDHEVV